MGGNYFDQIAREILQQKRLLDSLRAENRTLHQQLADLRSGRGIFIEIHEQSFALLGNEENTTPVHHSVQSLSEGTPVDVIASEAPSSEAVRAEAVLAPAVDTKTPVHVEKIQTHTATFLEEVMLDEFSSALTNPVATTPRQSEQQEPIDEEQKASLRRELMGSFLLE